MNTRVDWGGEKDKRVKSKRQEERKKGEMLGREREREERDKMMLRWIPGWRRTVITIRWSMGRSEQGLKNKKIEL